MTVGETHGFTPLMPKYSEVRRLLPVLDGVPKALMTSLISEIARQTGTPQQPLDWSNPHEWIPQRLTGDEAILASEMWIATGETVNPRHVRGAYYFINRHELLHIDTSGYYRLSSRSSAFQEEEDWIVWQIDDGEGIPALLGILAANTMAKFGDLLPEWSNYAKSRSNYRSESAIKNLLRLRLGNLLERGLISRDGIVYSVTPQGIDRATYLNDPLAGAGDPRQDVMRAIREFNNSQVGSLRELLSQMHPYKFEHLIRDLLEAMGYEDVTVTRESGDRGVDVVATVQFGITTITEVVQVKRHQGTIGRPTMDQLRGALPYHNAIRGTIITTGSFSSGCAEAALFMGAAPISLIDGNRLEELLVEHEIGIRKRPATLYEIDQDLFTIDDPERDIEAELDVSE